MKKWSIFIAIAGWGMVPAVLVEYPGDYFRLGAAILIGLIFTGFGVYTFRSG